MMILLRNKSGNIQFEAFHVFKVARASRVARVARAVASGMSRG